MFESYMQLIYKLFPSIFSGTARCLSFLDFLSIIGASLLLFLALLGILVLFGCVLYILSLIMSLFY